MTGSCFCNNGKRQKISPVKKQHEVVYRLDGKEVHRNIGLGDNYPEPMFAILNFAKITDNPMQGEWVMEVDWVKHEFRNN